MPFISDADLEAALDDAGASADATEAALDANADARLDGLRAALAILALLALLALFFAQAHPDQTGPDSTRGRSNDVPLACVFGIAHPARGAADQARPLADRPEPALPAGRDADER